LGESPTCEREREGGEREKRKLGHHLRERGEKKRDGSKICSLAERKETVRGRVGKGKRGRRNLLFIHYQILMEKEIRKRERFLIENAWIPLL